MTPTHTHMYTHTHKEGYIHCGLAIGARVEGGWKGGMVTLGWWMTEATNSVQ